MNADALIVYFNWDSLRNIVLINTGNAEKVVTYINFKK